MTHPGPIAAAYRVVICRPLGGLNDMLCQIEACCRYAARFDRTVVVDTDHPTSGYFRDDFSRYFESLQPDLRLDGRLPSGLPEQPPYQARYDRTVWRWVDAETDAPLSFDFETDHAAPVLLHQSDGGGEDSLRALGRMRLTAPLAAELERRLAAIGGGYIGVHIRNTDYRTDYGSADLDALVGDAPRIFVATDDAAVVEHFRRALGGQRVFAFASLPASSATPLHHLDLAGPARRRRNADAILDLVMLGAAQQLRLFRLAPNLQRAELSGYSRLAANLNRDRALLAQLRRLVSA